MPAMSERLGADARNSTVGLSHCCSCIRMPDRLAARWPARRAAQRNSRRIGHGNQVAFRRHDKAVERPNQSREARLVLRGSAGKVARRPVGNGIAPPGYRRRDQGPLGNSLRVVLGRLHRASMVREGGRPVKLRMLRPAAGKHLECPIKCLPSPHCGGRPLPAAGSHTPLSLDLPMNLGIPRAAG
jgi:hypothetical protein